MKYIRDMLCKVLFNSILRNYFMSFSSVFAA